MNEYYYKISPEVLLNKYRLDVYTGDTYFENEYYEVCCDIYTSAVTKFYTGQTVSYLPMDEILSGGTNGSSLLTGLTIPIMLTEIVNNIGVYSVFDGAVLQKDVMTNFLFSGDPINQMIYHVYNTSDVDYINYLKDFEYSIDWGDGSPIEIITGELSHLYLDNGEYTITMSGSSLGIVNVIKKDIKVPFTNISIGNPNGNVVFYVSGGNWSATPISYDYIFSGDSNCDVDQHISSNYTTVPFMVSGYTNSTINDLEVYGAANSLFAGKFKLDEEVTGIGGVVGTVWKPDPTLIYTAYTINGIDYYDYPENIGGSNYSTLFVTYSSGYTENNLDCLPITKDEGLMNVVDGPEVQSDIFIERGKYSAFEYIQRLNEVSTMGGLEKYGYGFFNIRKV
jgi:hypothetical protein